MQTKIDVLQIRGARLRIRACSLNRLPNSPPQIDLIGGIQRKLQVGETGRSREISVWTISRQLVTAGTHSSGHVRELRGTIDPDRGPGLLELRLRCFQRLIRDVDLLL